MKQILLSGGLLAGDFSPKSAALSHVRKSMKSIMDYWLGLDGIAVLPSPVRPSHSRLQSEHGETFTI
jgi:hypothetical protein